MTRHEQYERSILAPRAGAAIAASRGMSSNAPASTAANLCREALDAELRFYDQLEDILTALVTVNLFSPDSAASLSRRMDVLHQERIELDRRRRQCQQELARAIGRPDRGLRVAELEPLLPENERAELRQHRLLVLRRIEGIQRQLWRTDVLLAGRFEVCADLLAALTGQATDSNCYGATGRREHHFGGAVIEAVS